MFLIWQAHQKEAPAVSRPHTPLASARQGGPVRSKSARNNVTRVQVGKGRMELQSFGIGFRGLET